MAIDWEAYRKKAKKRDEYEYQKNIANNDIAPVPVTTTTPTLSGDDIAPPVTKKKDDGKRKWFEKGAFEDGYQAGDIAKTILGTVKDARTDFTAGALGIIESGVDAVAGVVGGVSGSLGNKDFQSKVEDFIEKDIIDEQAIAKSKYNPLNYIMGQGVLTPVIDKIIGENADDVSVLGDKADSLVESGGQLIAQAGLQGFGVPWWVTSGVTSFGGGMENALKEGATYNEAVASAGIQSAAEILTEKLFGGSGLGEKGLINLEPLTKGITSKLFKSLADYGIDLFAEGTEEVVSQIASNFGTALYKEDNLSDILFSEEAIDGYIESFIGGSVLGGGMNIGNIASSIKNKTDYRSGLTAQEEQVIEKEIENRIAEQEEKGEKLTKKDKAEIRDKVIADLDKGYISIDTIESALGGESYDNYKSVAEQEDALQKEFDTLNKMKQGDMTGEQIDRRTELKEQLKELKNNSKKTELKDKLSNDVFNLAKDSRLAESYNEKARRGQSFEADLSKYDTKQQEVIKKAVESGVLNNTNRTHEFVDMIAKISADKGVLFDFTNNEKLKNSGFALKGKTVNGYKTEDGNIALNIQSQKALDSVVGHEITHILEGTELYDTLQEAVKKYATTKGEYVSRMQSLRELYTDVYKGKDFDDKLRAELTADIVGDYLFSDSDFINNLSTEQPNLFKRIYNEIKYLCKVATAGSKEARELERVKKAFDNAWKESNTAQKNTTDKGDVKYSISRTQNMSWDDQINGLLKKSGQIKRSDTLVVEKSTPTYLQSDVIEDLPLAIPLSVVTKATNGKDVSHSIEKGKIVDLQKGIKNAEYVIKNPDRNSFVFVTDVKQNGHPILVSFLQNTEFDGDRVHKATSIHLQIDVDSMLKSLPETATIYVKNKNKFNKTVGATNNLRGLSANVEFIDDILTQNSEKSSGNEQFSLGLDDIETKYKDKTDYLFLHERDDTISISNMVVKKEYRNQGIGTQILNDVIAYADEKGKTITLTPTTEFGTQNKLKKWYKANGFVENKGRNADLRLSDTMYRLPKKSNSEKSQPQKQFSLSNSVEETKELVAVHGMTTQNLISSLELGGLPMPSIAIIKARMGHNKYGDVSLVFGKDTIDPELNNANKVYGLDVWSPVYPTIEFKVNEAVASKIRDKYYELGKKYSYDDARPLYAYAEELERQLNNAKGEQGLLEDLYNDVDLMKVYLLDSGKPKVDPVTVEERTTLSDMDVESIEYLIGEIGRDVIDEFVLPEGVRGPWAQEHKKAFWDKHFNEVQKAYRKMFMELDNFTEEDANKIVDNTSRFELNNWLKKCVDYIKNGKVKIKVTEDKQATEEAIEKAAQDGYVEWVNDLFKGVAEKSGIRNNVDYFDKYGNRRDWEALHYANKLENVVKVMKGQENGNSFFNAGALWAIAAKDYGTIQEIKADSDRLKLLSEDEYKELKKAIGARVDEIADSLNSKYSDSNYFIEHDNKINNLFDAIKSAKTKSGVLKYLNQYFTNATEATVTDLLDVIADAGNLPTEYFEAKPQRAVMFDEVKAVIIPDNAPQELREQLDSMGLNVLTYEHGNDNSRTEVLNSIDDVKFSLSKEGEQPTAKGRFYGKDMMLDLPIRKDVAKNATTTFDDIAPMTEAEAKAMRNDVPLTDADVPPEIDVPMYDAADTTKIDDTTLKGIGQRLRETLSLTTKETKAIQEVVQKYSTTEIPNSEQLFNEIKEKFSEKTWTERNEEIAEIKQTLKGFKIKVSDNIKNDIADYGEWQRSNFGKLRFSKDGLTVDDIYEGLSIGYPNFFPADVVNPTDQLLLMSEVASMDANIIGTHQLDDEIIQQATDIVISEVNKHKENELAQHLSEEQSHFYKSLAEETTDNQHIRTVKERLTAKLENVRKELLMNQQLRDDSIADFEQEITRLQVVYDGKRDKNTKVANDILRRIERLQTLKGNVEADYSKRISDLKEKRERLTKEMLTGESPTEQGAMRRELHESIVNNIKNRFEEKGFRFDDVFRYAKNLSTFATVDNTPQRVMEKALGYKQGQILADETVNKVAQNESEGIKWLNSFTDKKKGLLAQISKEYHIKPGSKKSAAAQMYAEGFYVSENDEIIKYGDRELAIDFPDGTDRQNIKSLANDPRIRQIYDETLDAINESRIRNAYPEIKKLDNYFLHFRAMEDTFSRLGLPFNPNDIKAKDLPTDLNGVTADLKPGQPYFASAMHRTGKRTSFDLLGGLERYLSSAKNQIYHIDDIQTLRALRNYIAETYGQAHGLEDIDSLSEEEAQERIKQVYDSHLSTFAKFLNEEANVIAGKTALIDRGLEGVIGRRGIQLLDTVNKQVGSNMVGGNISSALTNLVSVVQTVAKTQKQDSIKAFSQMASNKINSLFGKSDGFAEINPGIVRRKGAEKFARTPFEKVKDGGYLFASAVDNVATEFIVRTKFNEYTRNGMSEEQAHIEADKWASRLLGDRSLGQQPQLYNSKMLGLFTKFQLEVRNQLDTQFYDTIQEAKVSNEEIENALERNAKTAAKVTSTFVQLAVLQHAFGMAFESVAGYNPAFDIIDVLIKAFGFDDEEESEDTPLDNLEQGFLALLEDLPYTSTLTGGRIPISSALPIKELITGEDDYGTEKSRVETLKETLPYYLLPTGYGQLKKTAQGLKMFDDDLPIAGSYTDSGNLRFPVEDTPLNRVQAGLFGQYANENARKYFDDDIAPLNEKQIKEYADLDLPIADYWKYRERLKDFEKQDEKVAYINGLDVTEEQKNTLKSYLYDEEGYKEDNPEKYAFLESEGIGFLGYKEADEDTQNAWSWAFKHQDEYRYLKENGVNPEDYSVYYSPRVEFEDEGDRAYEWAFKNPEKATIGKVFGNGVKEYRQYTSALSELKADKDSNGKSISGSLKKKKTAYINNLDIDYGAKCILLKKEYPSDDTYNTVIFNYIKGRTDITYSEKKTILEELGATVDSNGNVRW